MGAQERLSALVDLLRQDGQVVVSDAAVRFGTAEMTIRRDLDVLVERGVARRIRGGAVNQLMTGDELPFRLRELDAVDAKRRIGAAVAELISEGEAVALDSGTTLFEVAKNLTSVRATVLPMSLQSALVLSQAPDVRLIIPGGEIRGGEEAMVGPIALTTITQMRFDTVVLGCCGISAEGQLMAHDLGDAAIKKALIASGRRCVLAVDGGKFGRAALAVVTDLAELDVIVTDESAPTSVVAALESAGVEVRRA